MQSVIYIRIYLILLWDVAGEAQMGPRHDVLAASRWRSSWEAGCQQLTAETETGVND